MARTNPARKTAAPQRTARNEDFTDREILANIQRTLDQDGWATTTDIAMACGFKTNGQKNKTLATKIAARLSYMRAMKLLTSAGPDMSKPYKEPGDRDTRWRLTPEGIMLLRGKLTKPVEAAIERMDPGQSILMMRELTFRNWIHGDPTYAVALRREFEHGRAQRRIIVRMGDN